MKLCYSIDDIDCPISLHQQGRDRFSVIYGQQRDEGLDYGTAASKLGEAIMHALACASRLDNRKKGEK